MKLLRQEILMTWRAEWFHTKGAFCDKLREINFLIVIGRRELKPVSNVGLHKRSKIYSSRSSTFS